MGRRAHGHQLTERDIQILRWIARHGVVTAELVGRRFFWRAGRHTYGMWAAYHRLAALERMRLIIRTKSYGYPQPVLRVTRAGARIADVGIRPAPLVASELHHSIALVWLTEYLLAENRGAELITERELRAQRYREHLEAHTGAHPTPCSGCRTARAQGNKSRPWRSSSISREKTVAPWSESSGSMTTKT
jgi:hypothetical protein